ncbi:MAG: hypothetical protein IKG81_11915 [Bacteroidales bacterium]|nr:hypothetical protein [Bacteroidales bacterium]
MQKNIHIRRIIGITAITLWVFVIVSKVALVLFGHGDRPIWQLDNWALLFAPILTMVFAIMTTSHISKGKHWAIKVMIWLGCTLVTLLCIATFFVAGAVMEYRIWGDKHYVVYSEWGGFTDPDVYVLYKRGILIDKRMYILDNEGLAFPFVLGDDNWGGLKKATFYVHDTIDLLECDAEIKSPLKPDSTYHSTIFYQLHNGQRFEQDQNDSLLVLIKNT